MTDNAQQLVQASAGTASSDFWGHFALFTLILLAFIIGSVLVFIWFERRAIARFQVRPGPNRAGIFGVLQPFADVIKILLKEDIVPDKADKKVHWWAPVVALVPAFMIFAVIPFE